MTPKRVDAGSRQSQILDAAAAVFAQKGFARTRMDDIAAEAELSKGSLYLYFDSKEAIILALLGRVFHFHEAEIEALFCMQDVKASDRVMLFVQTVAQQVTQLADLMRVSYQFYSMSSENKDVERHLKEYFVSYRTTMAKIFQQGIDRGEFCDWGSEQMATALIALLEGVSLLWLTLPGDIPIETTLEQSTSMLLAGMGREG